MIILFICLILYSAVLIWLALGFMTTRSYRPARRFSSQPVTIIICARNEEKRIASCLHSVFKQNYAADKMQVILVNDASTDATQQIAEGILNRQGQNHRIITNTEQQGKKRSITRAMPYAMHALIVARDADTFTTSVNWLQTISDFYQERRPDLIIAPVAIADNAGIFWALQAIENNILQLCAAGSAHYHRPFLCSGANLIFRKSLFEKMEGYASHLHVASGDDVLFLEDAKKHKASILYLRSREAIVYTYPCVSIAGLVRQKNRWVSKFRVNHNPLNHSLAVLTLVTNAGWVFCLLHGFINPANNSASLVFILLKLSIDFLLLFLTSRFIKNKGLLWYSLPVGCIYPLYTLLVGIASVILKPKWK